MENILLIGYHKEDKLHVLHMVVYENDITEEDLRLLRIELQQEKEFSWIFELNENIEAFIATDLDGKFLVKEKINGW
jgi:hypothetical protein